MRYTGVLYGIQWKFLKSNFGGIKEKADTSSSLTINNFVRGFKITMRRLSLPGPKTEQVTNVLL